MKKKKSSPYYCSCKKPKLEVEQIGNSIYYKCTKCNKMNLKSVPGIRFYP